MSGVFKSTLWVSVSCSVLFNSATPWAIACQAPLALSWPAGLPWPSSRGSSRPRDKTCVSCSYCFKGRFLTIEPTGKLSLLPSSLKSEFPRLSYPLLQMVPNMEHTLGKSFLNVLLGAMLEERCP